MAYLVGALDILAGEGSSTIRWSDISAVGSNVCAFTRTL